MRSGQRIGCAIAIALCLASAPAFATISVSFSPAAQSVPIAGGTATVDIVADIPANDAIIGWGLDLGLIGTSVSIANVAINTTLFDAVPAADGDDLAAIVPFDQSALDGIVTLATITFSLDALGMTQLALADDHLADATEGFVLDPSAPDIYADVLYAAGSIEVVPEPATLALLALGAIASLKRKR